MAFEEKKTLAALGAYFKRHGRTISPTGSQRLALDQDRCLWFVLEGQVDLFYALKEEGKTSRLHHFSRYDAGEFFFSVTGAEPRSDLAVIAIANGKTSLIEMALDEWIPCQLNEPFKAAMVTVLDRWIESLSSVLAGVKPSGQQAQLQANQPYEAPGKTLIFPKRNVLWVKPSTGEAKGMGSEWLLDEARRFPLTKTRGLTLEKGTVIVGVETGEYLDAASDWGDLEYFHAFALDGMARNHRALVASQGHRIQEKVRSDEVVLKRAFRNFSGLLVKESKLSRLESDVREPLFQACELVAKEGKIALNKEVLSVLKRSKDPLAAIARASNFRTRRISLTGKWWCADGGPLLGFWGESNQPVALLQRKPGKYIAVDPVEKTTIALDDSNARQLATEAFMFYRPLPGKALNFTDLLRHAGTGMGRDILVIFLMGVLAGLAGTATPFITGIIFDQVIPEAAKSDLLFLAMGLAVIAFSTGLFYLTRGFALLRVEGKIDISLQAAIWDRIMSLPVPFFRDYTAGDLLIRAMNIDTIRRTISGSSVAAMLAGVFSLFYFVQLFFYSWRMALLGAGLILLILLPLFLTLVQIKLEREALDIQGRLSGLILELINGIAKVRVSGSENKVFGIWAKLFRDEKALTYKSGMINNIVSTWNASFSIISLLAIYGFMIYLRGSGQPVSLGSFLAFFAAFSLFMAAMLEVSNTVVSLIKLVPAYERAKPILQAVPEESLGATPPGKLKGKIDVINLGFRYDKYGPRVIDEVTFSIEPGAFVGIVGPSGAGKSTLFRLLLGFENAEKGAVYYDGQELFGLDVREVRRQLGVVLQNGKLMPGSILENIVGSLPLGMDDAWDAARMAGIEADIKEMPMEMHTLISDSGSTLSGGQIQRLLIARALINKPRMLFFDEATSALDNQTQAVISQSLETLKITRVVIAHRISTIVNADKILVMDKGKIVESGTYDALMAEQGVFARLATRQLL